jgi:hypothetical protein
MAKDDQADIEMTVIHFKTKSSNKTLEENVRAIANTLTKALAPPTRVITVPPPPQLAGANGNGAIPAGELIDDVDDYIDANSTDSKPAKQPRARAARKVPPTPNILNDLGLDEGEVTFKDFVKQKDISNQNKKYLVVAAWFKKYKGIDEITPDHIFTCFQYMEWKYPIDMGKPFRNMKDTKSYFDNGEKPNHWAITIVGLNKVDQMKSVSGEA